MKVMLWQNMFDGPFTIQVNLPAVDKILPKSKVVLMSVNIKATSLSNVELVVIESLHAAH